MTANAHKTAPKAAVLMGDLVHDAMSLHRDQQPEARVVILKSEPVMSACVYMNPKRAQLLLAKHQIAHMSDTPMATKQTLSLCEAAQMTFGQAKQQELAVPLQAYHVLLCASLCSTSTCLLAASV